MTTSNHKQNKEKQTGIAIDLSFRDELRQFCAERNLVAKGLISTVMRKYFKEVRENEKTT
jgi:hypothetical protein